MNPIVDWEDEKNSHVFLNPRMPDALKTNIEESDLPHLPGHIWVASSGTSATDELKLVALSKRALLVSAQAVVDHIHLGARDVWLDVLPHFHVGGLSIYARSHLTGAKVLAPENWKWNPERFQKLCDENAVTVTSLVPAQVYDLVSMQLPAPRDLRVAIVGGGAMREGIYLLARKLGWPLLPSYGLTEAGSQVATASLDTLRDVPELVPGGEVLSHLEVKLAGNDLIQLKGGSLLTGLATITADNVEFSDPKVDGWLQTSDVGAWDGSKLRVLGRNDEVVKVGGELVNLNRLNHTLHSLADDRGLDSRLLLVPLPSDRLGYEVALIYHQSLESMVPDLVSVFSGLVHPYEQIRSTYSVEVWPETDLGKVRTGQLVDLIREQ
ncbi:MAG: AMP-binding protein [Bdellovibrionales bacterium]|nr:AMP-binding protein [Bdellovibrionales bacterium]